MDEGRQRQAWNSGELQSAGSGLAARTLPILVASQAPSLHGQRQPGLDRPTQIPSVLRSQASGIRSVDGFARFLLRANFCVACIAGLLDSAAQG